jgi:hypothetical protein
MGVLFPGQQSQTRRGSRVKKKTLKHLLCDDMTSSAVISFNYGEENRSQLSSIPEEKTLNQSENPGGSLV